METAPDLDRFGHDLAWAVGAGLVERCRTAALPVTIGIWLGDQRVFHAALPGSSVDNDRWIERKARIVKHFGQSSAEVAARYAGDDVEAFLRTFALSPELYFPAGGAVPIMVGGLMVGVLAVSGLASEDDHLLALEALQQIS